MIGVVRRAISCVFVAALSCVLYQTAQCAAANDVQSCTWDNRETCGDNERYLDPNLVPMTVDFGGRTDTVMVYMTPDVATFYNETPGSRTRKETKFKGLFGKFINMSNRPVRLHWISRSGQKQYIADIPPFGASGTATYPGHEFVLTARNDPDKEYQRWTIEELKSLYRYDEYGGMENAEKELTSSEFELYKLQQENLAFDKMYRYKTGRQWLSLYGRKGPPQFPMWPADSIGQTHEVITNETHFVTQPPDELVNNRLSPIPTPEDHTLRKKIRPYRSIEESLTLNLTVLSVAPRVFEIRNFLSEEEVMHIMELSRGIKLKRSTTRAGDITQETTNDSTRTSQNSWIDRQRSPIVDSIYRRAADLLQIDEACFRKRDSHETHLVPNYTGPITERLQLVRYEVGQQYTAHHDVAVPANSKYGQSSRFITLLLYLNEGMEGGETSFPRWLNGETTKILEVKPESGKAILFYSQLPDGNYDERSQHAAKKILAGEKWVTNLWVWDPHQ